LDQVRK
jgi:hypothetical protein